MREVKMKNISTKCSVLDLLQKAAKKQRKLAIAIYNWNLGVSKNWRSDKVL